MSFLSRPTRPGIVSKRAAFRVAALLTAALAAGGLAPAPACGPDFPNRYFDLSEAEILAAPEGYFAAEIAHLAAGRSVPHRMVYGQADETPDAPFVAEGAEVARALQARGVDAGRARRIGDAFVRARRELANVSEHGCAYEKIAVPAELPEEFRLYLLGAIAWYRDEVATAEQHWRAVLALPETERRFRSVWAAYMLGRAAENRVERDAAVRAASVQEAVAHFQLTRALASQGFHDTTGLAAESYGREARAVLLAGDTVRALNLYLDHHAAGASSATVSLRWAAYGLLDAPFADEVVRDPVTRRVLTALIVSRLGASAWASDELPFGKWAEDLASACERAGVADAPEADRLAWLAYEGGKFELAERWLQLAAATSPAAAWIRAKLALRAGDLAEGAKQLRTALDRPELPEAQRPRLSAELARVQLALNDYTGSLRTWLEGGHWQDAAYVAELILTVEELRAFVDREVPEPAKGVSEGDATAGLHGSLRGLLARRLARGNHYEAALRYCRDDDRIRLLDYIAEMRVGFDARQSAEKRSDAFWRSAHLMREFGLELFGTELEPDWNIWGGYFDFGSARLDRLGTPRVRGSLLSPTPDEIARLEKARAPKQRFHFRYRAAEIAGWAAALLPNDTEKTAHILYTAGGWLKARDPEAANPFYRLLVIRCGNTPLGRAAAAKHWFPEDEAAAIAEFSRGEPAPPTTPSSEPKRRRLTPKEALRPIQQRPGPRR